jgi:hypothetical protein
MNEEQHVGLVHGVAAFGSQLFTAFGFVKGYEQPL